jgi:hypothetical protein
MEAWSFSPRTWRDPMQRPALPAVGALYPSVDTLQKIASAVALAGLLTCVLWLLSGAILFL